jgi:hypothetical protein
LAAEAGLCSAYFCASQDSLQDVAMPISISLPLADLFIRLCEESLSRPSCDIELTPWSQTKVAIEEQLLPPQGSSGVPASNDTTLTPPHDIFYELIVQLALADVLWRKGTNTQLKIARLIRDAVGSADFCRDIFQCQEEWKEAIRISAQCDSQYSAHHSLQHVTLGLAIRYFEKRQISFQVNGSLIHVPTESTKKALASTVAAPMGQLGASSVHFLMQAIAPRLDPVRGKLRFFPMLSTFQEKTTRSVPYGYLYRIALQQLHKPDSRQHRLATFKQAEEAATHLAALFDVEPWNAFAATQPVIPTKFIQAVLDTVMYDHFFCIPQMESKVVEQLLKSVLFPVARERTTSRAWLIDGVRALWDTLRRISTSKIQGIFIQKDDLLRETVRSGSNAGTAAKIIELFTAVLPGKDYLYPTSGNDTEFFEAALVQTASNRLWIPPETIMNASFYNKAFRVLAEGQSDFNTDVGKRFEKRMLERLDELHIKHTSGTFEKDGEHPEGDVDLALETDDYIFLFELKAKALRASSKAGMDIDLLIDLSDSYVYAAMQLCRQERRLVETGSIILDSGKIEWKNRRIIKVVLSLSDYGGLHDFTSVRNTLNSLVQINLNLRKTDNSTHNRRFKNVLKNAARLKTIRNALAASPNNPSRDDPLDNIYFYNYSLIEEVLSHATSAQEFIQSLRSAQRVLTGTRDPAHDIHYMRTLTRTAEAERAAASLASQAGSPPSA